MPIFELEKDGKTFEIDAPDMQSAVGALGNEKSIGGFFSNLASNAQEVGGHLVEAASDPLGTAETLGKTFVGMAQQFVPGQQEWETQYADPLYKQMGKDFGFAREPNGSIGWSGERLANNLYERPVDLALDASMVASPAPGMVGRAARAANIPYQAAKGVTTVAKRAVTPFPARPAAAQAAKSLEAEGVPLTAGQATGNKMLKYTESELGGGRVGDMLDLQGEQFTRAGSRRIGMDTPNLDGPTMEGAYRRIGNDINTVAARNTLRVDRNMQRDAYNAAGEYNRNVPISQRVPMVDQYLAEIQALRGSLPGDRYQALRSQLGADARAATEPHLRRALYGLQRSLDDAMERSVAPADRGAFREARRQYRNYLVLEAAMATGGAETAAGILTPAKLEQALNQVVGKRGYLHGRHDFGSLAKAGKVSMSKMPESGTSYRSWARAAPTVVGAGLGAATGGGVEAMVGAAAGAAAPAVAGRAIMSRPVQAYLGNQMLPGQIPGGAIAGRAASTAIAATPRVESLKHADNVLSTKVLEHVKRSPETRGYLARWLKARESGRDVEKATRELAEAIAKEVKRPELAGRIESELSAAKDQ